MDKKVLYNDEELSKWIDYIMSSNHNVEGEFIANLVGDIEQQEPIPVGIHGDEGEIDARYLENGDIFIDNPHYMEQPDRFAIYNEQLNLMLTSKNNGIEIFIPKNATKDNDDFKETLLSFCKEIVKKSTVKFPKKEDD